MTKITEESMKLLIKDNDADSNDVAVEIDTKKNEIRIKQGLGEGMRYHNLVLDYEDMDKIIAFYTKNRKK